MNLGVMKNILTLIIDTMFVWGVISIWHYQSYHVVFDSFMSVSTSFVISMLIVLLYLVFEVFGYSLSSYLTESVVHDSSGMSISSYVRLKRVLYKYMFIATLTVSLFGLYLFNDGYLLTIINEKSMVFVEALFVGWWSCFTLYMFGVWLKRSEMFYDRYTNTKLISKSEVLF